MTTQAILANPDHYCNRPPEQATRARPGSDEKIRVLIERAEQGVDLFHRDDPTVAVMSAISTPTIYVVEGISTRRRRHTYDVLSNGWDR